MLGEESGGRAFFQRLKAQLDTVLSTHFPVHFFFFAEAPDSGSVQPAWNRNVYGEPPSAFAFLKEVFGQEGERTNGTSRYPHRVSFINDLNVKATIYHQMNADMVITTGSSFPLVALTVSPKVCM